MRDFTQEQKALIKKYSEAYYNWKTYKSNYDVYAYLHEIIFGFRDSNESAIKEKHQKDLDVAWEEFKMRS